MKFKNYLAAFFFIFIILKLPKQYFNWTGGFRLSSCQTGLDNRLEWETGTFKGNLEEGVFNQPYSYYQRGSQAYIFLSQDRKYVLKIFAKPLRKYVFPYKLRPPFVRTPPNPHFMEIQNGVEGYKLASFLPNSATGLVYLHLNTTEGILPSIVLRDAMQRRYTVPLDSYRFVIQKKCERLSDILKKTDPQEAKKIIQSYLDAISLRASFGLRNSDTEFKKNFGVFEGKVIEFDCGGFVYDPLLLSPSGEQEEVALFEDRLHYWMDRNLPRL